LAFPPALQFTIIKSSSGTLIIAYPSAKIAIESMLGGTKNIAPSNFERRGSNFY